MINFDTQLLDSINEKELWLVMHIAKRMQSNRMTAWPALETIASDCKWDERTVKSWRKSLQDKNFIEVTQRPGKTPLYRFKKQGIGVFMGLENAADLAEELPNEGDANFVGGTKNEGGQNLHGEGVQKMRGEGVQILYPELVSKEVISKEVISNNNTAAENPNSNNPVEAEQETGNQGAAAAVFRWKAFDIDASAKTFKADALALDKFGMDLGLTLVDAIVDFPKHVDQFVKDQKAVGFNYQNDRDFRRHFFNWVLKAPAAKKKAAETPRSFQQTQASGTTYVPSPYPRLS